jgi:hypothetical protein
LPIIEGQYAVTPSLLLTLARYRPYSPGLLACNTVLSIVSVLDQHYIEAYSHFKKYLCTSASQLRLCSLHHLFDVLRQPAEYFFEGIQRK